ncbi:Helix-turn-helix domain of resolvase [Poriferisphaera corsica]|uniref:Helix-turn-helix domain of resolvase n=1 Tax=Poriferisphaera corsica TaxID=2528020 RepID=A0A517YTW5_9BACT|nr:hypothetical protein [Poriferisphaera corsica]QDU33675.1 Helix-turn-helix domain of resolvase [Poriferisphaera corsica]
MAKAKNAKDNIGHPRRQRIAASGNKGFLCRELETLNRQLLYAPAKQRKLQYQRAEKLHDQIVDEQYYPLDFVVYRLTDSRVGHDDEVLLIGEAIKPDLRLMIDAITRSLELDGNEDTKPVVLISDLADRFNVSTKTVMRWRKEGLRWRQVRLTKGKKRQIVFTEKAIENFQKQNKNRIHHAAHFQRHDEQIHMQVIELAKSHRLSNPDLSFNRIAVHVSRELDLANETVRQIIRKHDDKAEKNAVFITKDKGIKAKEKQRIMRMHVWGIKTQKIANRYNRSLSTIYRIINEVKYRLISDINIDYLMLNVFDRDDAETVIRRQSIEEIVSQLNQGKVTRLDWPSLPNDLLVFLEQPRISDQIIRSLFVRYNYVKFKANHVRSQIDANNPRAYELKEFDQYLHEGIQIHSLLMRYFQSYIGSTVKLHLPDYQEAPLWLIVRLLLCASACLSDTLRSYNPSRSSRFSTLLKNYLMKELIKEQQSLRESKAVKRENSDVLIKRFMINIKRLQHEL